MIRKPENTYTKDYSFEVEMLKKENTQLKKILIACLSDYEYLEICKTLNLKK